jgi:hypothetical protein
LPHKHLIAQGFAPGAIADVDPRVSVLNVHAARADLVAKNYHLNRVIADDETGGADRSDRKYRTEGWEFLLAGGGVYDHLDFSFTPNSETGRAVPLPEATPGGGGPELRKQLAILKKFVESFDFVQMSPGDHLVKVLDLPATEQPSVSSPAVRVLAKPGQAYAIYVNHGRKAKLSIDLPRGTYTAEWINTKTGKAEQQERISVVGEATMLLSPDYDDDIALSVRRAH